MSDAEGRKRRRNLTRSLLVGALAVVGSSGAIYCGISPSKIDKEREGWSPTACTVTESGVRHESGTCGRSGVGFSFEPAIRVKYEVSGKPFNRLAGFITTTGMYCGSSPSAEGRAVAQGAADNYPLNAELTCVVDPNDPTKVHVPLLGLAAQHDASGISWLPFIIMMSLTIGLCIKLWMAFAVTPRPPRNEPEED